MTDLGAPVPDDIGDFRGVVAILDVFAEHECHDALWWRTDGDYAPVTFFVNCNDLFAWACADCEPVTPTDVPAIRGAFSDAAAANEVWHGPILWVARKRGMRPQRPYYKHFTAEMAKLFDACAPLDGITTDKDG